MASAASYEAELNAIKQQLNPMLDAQSQAPEFFQKGISSAFLDNQPLLREGANLSAGMYTLPQKLMEQYNMDFGNTFGGASGAGRLNSILGRLGQGFGLMDFASGLAKQRGADIKDISGNLTNQYGLALDALKQKYAMTQGQQQMAQQAEESARARAAAGAQQSAWNDLQKALLNQKTASPAIDPNAIGQRPDGSFIYNTKSTPVSSKPVYSSMPTQKTGPLAPQYFPTAPAAKPSLISSLIRR